jgi:hypothetical protein
MKRFSLPLSLLLFSAFAVAQDVTNVTPYTTTTYNLSATNTGTWGGYLRAFGVQASPLYLNWIQNSGACNGQEAPFLGFVYLTLPGQAESPCAPLTSTSQVKNGTDVQESGSFAGTDANGAAFSGSYSFDLTVVMKCGSGRGGCHQVFTINSGVVTITQ